MGIHKAFKGNLTDDEWNELIGLEYVLTWGYDEGGEYKRYKELCDKK